MKLSPKQKECLDFVDKGEFFALLEGAIRSGKSYIAVLMFLIYTQRGKNRDRMHMITGRNLLVMEKELLSTFEQAANDIGVHYRYNRSAGQVHINGVKYFVVAGHDHNSAKRIQSLTAGCALMDEVALVPQDFFEMAVSRLTFDDSKIIATCNPEGNRHWLKVNWIDENKVDRRYRFTLDDNPMLGEKAKQRYDEIFSGVFHERNIMGKWSSPEGAIYKTYNKAPRVDFRQIQYYDVGVDYGIKSVTAYVKVGWLYGGGAIVTDCYTYSGEDKVKTDQALVTDLIDFVGKDDVRLCLIDPSASSFIAELAKRPKTFTYRFADNKVKPGIKEVLNGLETGRLSVLNTTNNQHLFDEFELYEWNPKKDDEPIKEHDHHCDALRYAYYHRMKGRGNRVIHLPRGL